MGPIGPGSNSTCVIFESTYSLLHRFSESIGTANEEIGLLEFTGLFNRIDVTKPVEGMPLIVIALRWVADEVPFNPIVKLPSPSSGWVLTIPNNCEPILVSPITDSEEFTFNAPDNEPPDKDKNLLFDDDDVS